MTITHLIPQRPPMQMVDALIKADETSARTSFLVLATNIFCADGQLQPTALIENIAQTAAAHAGQRAKALDSPPVVGFIGAIKGFQLHRLPKVGEQLETEINITSEVLNFSVVYGKVWIADECIAEAELKIFLSNS